MKLNFNVSLKPQGKGRPRFTKTGHAYTPKNTKEAEVLLYNAIAEQLQFRSGVILRELPTTKPVHLSATWTFATPQSYQDRIGKYHTIKPDVDNLFKLVGDALEGLIWANDKQICSGSFKKLWGPTNQILLDIEF